MNLLGLEFADLDATEAASVLAGRDPLAPFGYVVTPNADHLVRLSRCPDLLPLYRGALMRLLDSRVVARTARLVGLQAPAVAPGSDLTVLLLVRHLSAGERVTIVGLSPARLPALVNHCDLETQTHFDTPRGFESDPLMMRAAVEFVLDHPARFVFLAVGSPRQEMLAAAVQATGRACGIGLCIGASLDFLAGGQRRAPVWAQRAGLEWLHRLGQNPRRMARRYLVDSPTILPILLRECLARRSTGVADGRRGW